MSSRPRNRPRRLTSQRTPWEDKRALQKPIRPRIPLHLATLPLRGPDLDFCIPSPRTPSGGALACEDEALPAGRLCWSAKGYLGRLAERDPARLRVKESSAS